MDLREAFEKKLLKKDVPDTGRAKKSLEVANHKLELAERAFGAKLYEDTIINAYTAMFHAGRAILYRDGIAENSHYGVYVYLREKYKEKIEPRHINELNALRTERHELMYGLEKSTEVQETEAENVISIATSFVEAVESLLNLRTD